MLSCRLLVVILVSSLAACSGSSASPAAAVPDGSAPSGGPIGDPGQGDREGGTPSGGPIEPGTTPDGGGARTGAHVSGTLRGSGGQPLAGREVRVLDSGGFGSFATTDDTGAFAFDRVALPYDLHLEGGTDFLALRASALSLNVGPSTSSGNYRNAVRPGPILVTLPDCGSAFCAAAFLIDVHPSTDYGSTPRTASYASGMSPASLDAPWTTWIGADTTPCTVRVLVRNDTSTKYWYAEEAGTLSADVGATPGALTLAGPLVPAALPATSLTATVDRSALPAAQTVTLTAALRAPTWGAGFPFATITNPVAPSALWVPQIAGASLIVTAATPPGQSSGSSQSTFRGPLSTATTALVLISPPQFLAPVSGGALTSKTTFTWSGGAAGGLYRLSLQQGSSTRTVFTMDTSVAVARLFALDGTSPGFGAVTAAVASWGAPAQGIDGFVLSGADVGGLNPASVSGSLGVTRHDPNVDGG